MWSPAFSMVYNLSLDLIILVLKLSDLAGTLPYKF